MACALTSGRTEPCKDAVGGIKAAYFIDYVEDSFTVSGGEATAIDAGVTTTYEYELNSNNNTFVQTATSSKENGTTTYLQTLTLSLKKQTQASAEEIHLLMKSRPVIVVRDNMGNYQVMGISDGTVGTGEIASGGAKEDFNGYTLTFTATEVEPAPFLDATTKTAFIALISGTNITP